MSEHDQHDIVFGDAGVFQYARIAHFGVDAGAGHHHDVAHLRVGGQVFIASSAHSVMDTINPLTRSVACPLASAQPTKASEATYQKISVRACD